jgi:RNA polymerase sigma factor (TIGR02999 family)
MTEERSQNRPASQEDITALLAALEQGQRPALDRLFGVAYAQLRQLSRRQRAGQGPATLSTTALVHEVYLKLVRSGELAVTNREHFFCLAARTMRQILIDHARKKSAGRRLGSANALPLDEADQPVEVDLGQVLAVGEALDRLEKVEPRLARLVEWRVFGGMTLEEIAPVTGLSPTTLKRDWKRARAYLARQLEL